VSSESAPRELRAPYLGIGLLSAGAVGFLFWLIYFRDPLHGSSDAIAFLPAVNASLNGLSAVALILGFRAIKRGERQIHKRFMLSALGFSVLFLISYVIYHALHGDTPFLGQGPIRPLYFGVLISHILLSIVALPIVLTTTFFALRGRFQNHKRIARITFPIWLYVSVTGVLIFALLKAYN